MTLLVARQCRLLGAARSLRRLPAAITARAYADDASPQRPFRVRRVAGKTAGGPLRPTIEGNIVQFDASVNPVEDVKRGQPPNHRPPRNYNLLVTPPLHACEIGSVNSAILVPASVAATTPEHFVEKIESLPADTVNGTDLVVFLTTPSFATWLTDDSVFLEKALAKLYKNIAWSASLQAVCAVVDKLPQARPIPTEKQLRETWKDLIKAETVYEADGSVNENLIRAAMADRAMHPPVSETGVEGIAYVILPKKAALSAQPTVSGEQGSIDFVAHTKTTEKGRDHDRVRVPLANTVFQTGVPSTLISSSWSLSTGGMLERQSREQPKTMSIDLSARRLDPALQTKSPRHHDVAALSIPLIPLTFPRKVDGHMGNIIRGLKDANGNAMTASSELEQVVPRYFAARGETPQATSAWAVVSTKRTARKLIPDVPGVVDGPLDTGGMDTDRQLGLEQLWTADPPRWDPRQRVPRSFSRDARLHKVLSGGGGWGKKAGLLSLDPMPIGAPQPERPAEMDGDYETVDEFSTALKPVVKDGHWISFYISPTVAQDSNENTDVHGFLDEGKSSGTSARQPWSWEFGVIPSTVDSIPGDSPQRSSEAPGEITVHKGTFGALTERGLTLMRGTDMDERSGIARKDLNATTIDVPFARWSAMRLVPKEGVKLQTITELVASRRNEAEKTQVAKGVSNVSVRDFSTSTFAMPSRPTAATLGSTMETPQWPRAFSSTCTAAGRRAWLPYAQHKERQLRNGIPSTEQDGSNQNTLKTNPAPQASPEKAKAILANLKIPVWKRVTITKVSHHFDDVQWAGQKDRDLLIRRTKSTTPAHASASPESQAKRGPKKNMVMYRPGGIEPKSRTEMLDEPEQEPLPCPTFHGSSSENLARTTGPQRSRDGRTLSTTPKRPDTVLNEWDFTAPTGQSRSFSTSHLLAKGVGQVRLSHERRSKKRALERAPLIKKVEFGGEFRGHDSKDKPEPDAQRGENVGAQERTILVRKLFDKQAPLGPVENHGLETRNRNLFHRTARPAERGKTSKAEYTRSKFTKPGTGKPAPEKDKKTKNDTHLPRLLRQARGQVPPRKQSTHNGVVRKIPILVPSSADKLVQQYFTRMQTTGRHIAMLTKQLSDITGLERSQLQAWTASQQRDRIGKNPGGRKRKLIRSIPFTSPRPSAPKPAREPARVRIAIPRRRRLPHRNPAGLEFVMQSFPLDLPPSTDSSLSSSSPPPFQSALSDQASLGVIPFHPLFTRILLANLVRNRPELLRRQFLPSLYQQAERMIKRSQILAATARSLLPNAPVLISSHSTRLVPRSINSRRPTIAPAPLKTGVEHKSSIVKKRDPYYVRRLRNKQRYEPERSGGQSKPRARRVPLGGWKHMYKYLSAPRRARIRKFAEGELAIKKVARKSRRQALADDVEGWLTGDGPL